MQQIHICPDMGAVRKCPNAFHSFGHGKEYAQAFGALQMIIIYNDPDQSDGKIELIYD